MEGLAGCVKPHSKPPGQLSPPLFRWETVMTVKSFRDITSWIALTSGLALFVLDWYCRSHCWRINEQGWGETTTPKGVGTVWYCSLY